MPSAPTTCPGTWPGSGSGSTPRACSPGPGRGAVHRLPDQVPHQAGRRLPPGHDRRTAGSRRPAGRGAAVSAVLAAVRELAAVRHPAQERPAGPGPRPVQGQSSRRRSPRLRRAAGPGLAQVVRQDAGRPPRRPQGLAIADPRCFGNRPGPVRLGTRRPVRPGPPGSRPADAPRRSRPAPMADSTSRGQETGRDATRRRYSGNREGSLIMRHTVDRTAQGPGMTRLLLTVPEAAEALAISRSKLYELLAAGVVASIRIDGSRRIPLAALETYMPVVSRRKMQPDGRPRRDRQAGQDVVVRRPGQRSRDWAEQAEVGRRVRE